jgi:hypothetical protein
MTVRTGLLAFTIAVAVGLSVGMWVAGTVPFNWATFSLHVASIYIGAALVLLYEHHAGR